MKLNKKPEKVYTYEGAIASRIKPLEELKRAVLSCLLWEDQFYENGENIATRIHKLTHKCNPQEVVDLAIETRQKHNLRHAPLWLVLALLNHPDKYLLGGKLKYIVARVIQRADEITEILAMYWRDGKRPIPTQLKYGLSLAFKQFNEYQLAKYNRKNTIKLKDVLKLTHPKPDTEEQSALWERLLTNNLKIPDTWEVMLSSGGDKKAHWERLLKENKLGGLALLRNLRNCLEVDVDSDLIISALQKMKTDKILPFRFITAAKHVPKLETAIEKAMFKTLSQKTKLKGKTILIVDVSGSMYNTKISQKSELNRAEVACALGLFMRELAENPVIYATSGNDWERKHKTKLVPARRGFALKDAIYTMCQPLGGGGIFLKQVMDYIYVHEKTADRIIVITDEQDCDNNINNSPNKANAFGKINYIINVASYEKGIAYTPKWHHINGFSEAIITYIQEYERLILN